MEEGKSSGLGFEFVDIEIISPVKDQVTQEKWDCDHCSLYFLTQEKLNEHKQRHSVQLIDETVKCKYCSKIIFNSAKNKVCYTNRKCETCEYRCSSCPKRFLRHSSLVNHERNHGTLKTNKKGAKNTSKTVDCHTHKIGKVKRNSVFVPVENEQKNKKNGAVKRKTPNSICDQGESNGPLLQKISPKKRKVQILEKKVNGVNVKKSTTRQIKIEQDNSDTSIFMSVLNEKVISYKPFSCHVCGDNFATDGALINHIKVHGGNASTAFKCKWCGDKFDDLYKMQFHLAICPLAEDELESTITQTIPIKLPADKTSYVSPEAKLLRNKRRQSQISQVIKDSLMEGSADGASTSQARRRSQRKKELNSKSDIVVYNETTELGYEELQNNDPEEDPLENIEINFAPENVSPEQSFNANEDHRTKDHTCPFPRCGMQFSREKALLCHMRNHSDDFDDTLKCHKCDIPFDDIHSLRLHINVCKGIKEEKDDDFNQPDYLSSKTKNRFSSRSKNELLCKVCGRTYKTQEQLNRHVLRHRSTNYTCRVCEQVFKNRVLLDKHNLDKHPIKSPHHCQICKEDFISEQFLQIHKSDYHGEYINKTQILQDVPVRRKPTLKIPSTRLKNLKKHSNSSTIFSYRPTGKHNNNCWCPICYEKFNERASLRSHLQHHHIDMNKDMFICEVCEVSKPNAEMLRYHLELHSFNPLSVNRFCKLRECTSNPVSDSKVNKSCIKKENISDNEDNIEIKQEVQDHIAPKKARRRSTKRKKSKTGKTLKKSLPNKLTMDYLGAQLGEDITPQFKTKEGRQKGKNIQPPLKSTTCNDAVDLVVRAVDDNDQSGALPTIQTSAETKKETHTQHKFKSNGKGRKRSRVKGNRKNEFNKKPENISKVITKEENELTYELHHMGDAINLLTNEEGISGDAQSGIHGDNEVELQPPTTDKEFLTQSKAHSKCKTEDNHIGSVSNTVDTVPDVIGLASTDGLDNHIILSYENLANQTTTDNVLLPAIISSLNKDLGPSRSESEAEDEIHCTMCSLKFRQQDDLLDHVGSHI